jgi:hypothetical protein
MKRLVLVCSTMSLLACSPGYKSGATKCDANLGCPGGYMCGAAGSSGEPDVCYALAETHNCADTAHYWCPDSQSCWASKVACETVTYCPDQNAYACPEGTEGTYRPSCSTDESTDECISVSAFSCSSQTSDNSCMTCARQACCVELSNCKNQPDCLSLNACLTGCSSNDASCVKRCEDYYPSAADNQDAYWGCLDNKCGSKCN